MFTINLNFKKNIKSILKICIFSCLLLQTITIKLKANNKINSSSNIDNNQIFQQTFSNPIGRGNLVIN